MHVYIRVSNITIYSYLNYIAYDLGIFAHTGMLFHFENAGYAKERLHSYTSSSIPSFRSSKHEGIQLLDTGIVLS